MDGSSSKNHKPINMAVETFYHKTVDSIMLNHDRLMGVSALISLNKTQDSQSCHKAYKSMNSHVVCLLRGLNCPETVVQ